MKPHGRSPLSVKLATDLALEEHESANSPWKDSDTPLPSGICDSMSAVACQIASVDAGGNRPKAVSCSDGVLLGGDIIICQSWQPLSRSPSSSLMKDVNVCVMMPDQP